MGSMQHITRQHTDCWLTRFNETGTLQPGVEDVLDGEVERTTTRRRRVPAICW